ncbi:HD domain-containing protein [Curtobacterium sp. MCLR17_042]|uniref:HD domain-containing protein n=1 Tax=Curtobacterium sp. MCLR17_042 TaxID=2175626 RepID=UPI000DA74026|nr:HD domain-containing protein [Curtobacterium sp. MCLR17_042]PZE28384.1 hypothetical protein DEJ02_07935 [Curtobacterium sp. MCLR17_042]
MLDDDLREVEQPDLADAVGRIPIAVADWWKTPMQWSFTDHGPAHSRRVAQYALEIADKADVSEKYALNPIERFVLWAAAWVHDLGMQNLRQTEDVGEIRSTHPERSRQILEEERINLGTTDRQVLNVIGIVANAHGTHYYRRVVDEEGASQRLRGHSVRVALLAALLLMADELDLNTERALPDNAPTEFENDTAAHWLKHQCVQDAELHNGSWGMHIRIAMLFPKQLSFRDRAAIQQWIRDKLQRQIALVDPELQDGFNGKFEFDPNITFTSSEHRMAQKYATSEVMAVIHRENARSKLINHVESAGRATAALDKSRSILLIGGGTADGRIQDGRDDLFDVLLAHAAADDVVVGSAPLPTPETSLAASDVLYAWTTQLAGEPPELDVTLYEHDRRRILLGVLQTQVREGDGRIVLGLPGWEQLSLQDAAWLSSVVFKSLGEADSLSLVVSTTPDRGHPETLAEWEHVIVGETSSEALRHWVVARTGRQSQRYKSWWIDYATAKRTTLDTESQRAAGE